MRIFLLCLAACNQTWGLDATRLPRLECPALGGELVVGKKLRQATTEYCRDYSVAVDTDRAVALCNKNDVAVGEIAGTLAVTPFPASPNVTNPALSSVRIAPEGDEIWIANKGATTNNSTHSVYRLTGTAWTWQYDIPFIPNTMQSVLAGPTRAPNRRMIVDDYYSNDPLIELAEQARGQWVEVRRYTEAELGVDYFTAPSMSADGLRLIYYADHADGTSGWFYSDRASVDEPFSSGRFVRGLPANQDFLHLSEDCSRAYFPALESIFYLTLD